MSAAGFWYRECPFCEQGRLFVLRDVTRGRLYLHCEECESGYPTPDDADQGTGWFQTAAEDFEAAPATAADIEAAGWRQWPLHQAPTEAT